MSWLSGTGFQREIVIVTEATPSTLNKRGPGFDEGPAHVRRVKAVVNTNKVGRTTGETGGIPSTVEYEFYVDADTVELDLDLVKRPVKIQYKQKEFIVTSIQDWPTHQVLTAEIGEER